MIVLKRAVAFAFWLLAVVTPAAMTSACAGDVTEFTQFRATDEALAAMVSDDNVSVAEGEWIAFRPSGEEPTIGFIFYPGRLADPRGYAPVMREIAAAGYLGIIVPMPGNIATNGVDKALDVQAAFPAIEKWVISGHSLGGTVAAAFLRGHPESADALILFDSYLIMFDSYTKDAPPLTNTRLPILSLYANSDLYPARLKRFNDSKQFLPDHARYQAVEGGDHMQFGSFRPEDTAEFNTATISEREQREMIIADTLAFLAEVFSEN